MVPGSWYLPGTVRWPDSSSGMAQLGGLALGWPGHLSSLGPALAKAQRVKDLLQLDKELGIY